jgi:hypothetical protein
MEQLIFFLVVGVIFTIIKVVSAIRKAADSYEQNQKPGGVGQPRPVQRRYDGQSEEERMRKFLEALGVPPGTTPPPRISRPAPPPLPGVPARQAPRRATVEIGPPLREPVRRAAESPRARTRPTVDQPPPMPAAPPRSAPSSAAVEPETRAPGASETQAAAELAWTTAQPSAPGPAAPSAQQRERILALLKSAGTLRTAVVLREILGPPRSLQPSEFQP